MTEVPNTAAIDATAATNELPLCDALVTVTPVVVAHVSTQYPVYDDYDSDFNNSGDCSDVGSVDSECSECNDVASDVDSECSDTPTGIASGDENTYDYFSGSENDLF